MAGIGSDCHSSWLLLVFFIFHTKPINSIPEQCKTSTKSGIFSTRLLENLIHKLFFANWCLPQIVTFLLYVLVETWGYLYTELFPWCGSRCWFEEAIIGI